MCVCVRVRIQMGSSGLLQTLSDSGSTRALAFGSCICVGVEQPKHSNKMINESVNVCKTHIYAYTHMCSLNLRSSRICYNDKNHLCASHKTILNAFQ